MLIYLDSAEHCVYVLELFTGVLCDLPRLETQFLSGIAKPTWYAPGGSVFVAVEYGNPVVLRTVLACNEFLPLVEGNSNNAQLKVSTEVAAIIVK